MVGTSKRKRPHGRSWHRWEDNITVDLREIASEVIDWIHLAQYRDHWRVFVNSVMNLRVPS
jgi:hypothetical protein